MHPSEPTATTPLRRLDPAITHRIDARALLALLPNFDQRHLTDVRQQFAQFLHHPDPRTVAAGLPDWQTAWNAWTGATPDRPGLITIRVSRCPDCSHGVSHRNISRNIGRTGHPHICGSCRGTGRGTNLRQSARYATPPAPVTEAAAPEQTS